MKLTTLLQLQPPFGGVTVSGGGGIIFAGDRYVPMPARLLRQKLVKPEWSRPEVSQEVPPEQPELVELPSASDADLLLLGVL